jgi:DNA-binding NarL/FixJ family response regulator
MEKAVVVDVDYQVAAEVMRSLQSWGIACEHCASLAEVRTLFASQATPPAYVILDLQLSSGDVADILDLLSEQKPRPLVAITSSSLTAQQVLALRNQCIVALQKPVGASELEQLARLFRETRTPLRAVERFAQHHKLSPKETSLFQMAVDGANNDEAAEALGCARPTVSTYWSRIFRKTGFQCQRDVVAALLRYSEMSR